MRHFVFVHFSFIHTYLYLLCALLYNLYLYCCIRIFISFTSSTKRQKNTIYISFKNSHIENFLSKTMMYISCRKILHVEIFQRGKQIVLIRVEGVAKRLERGWMSPRAFQVACVRFKILTLALFHGDPDRFIMQPAELGFEDWHSFKCTMLLRHPASFCQKYRRYSRRRWKWKWFGSVANESINLSTFIRI